MKAAGPDRQDFNPLDLDACDRLEYAGGIAPAFWMPSPAPPDAGARAPAHAPASQGQPEGEDSAGAPEELKRLFAHAVELGASDLHFEPCRSGLRVRARVDGRLRECARVPAAMRLPLISRLKLSADINIAEKRMPQDGRARLDLDGTSLDLRVATVPTLHGESAVVRLLPRRQDRHGLGDLGLDSEDRACLQNMLGVPGLILIAGPTGSGKTSTLYSCLDCLNDGSRKIITVEDPVEYQIPGITQVPARSGQGTSFGLALRAMLRQAPDVIMIGEIRDRETAEIAVSAALTGHGVLSSLHAPDAPGAVTRMLDLGVEASLLAAVLQGVWAQRLVRRICGGCTGSGCRRCSDEGLRGRIGIFERLAVGEAVQAAVREGLRGSRLRAVLRRHVRRSLWEDGLRQVREGVTTRQELGAVLGENEADVPAM